MFLNAPFLYVFTMKKLLEILTNNQGAKRRTHFICTNCFNPSPLQVLLYYLK
jgi:hypothetical protein